MKRLSFRSPRMFVRWAIAVTAMAMVVSPFPAGTLAAERTRPAAQPTKPVLPANLRTINLWTRALGSAKLPDPWRAAPCDTKAPLLCVYRQGTFVGTLELGTYLIGSRADLRKKLTQAGISATASAADPKYRSQLEMALKAWVADYYAFFKTDRGSEYGTKVKFTAQPPTRVTIGKLKGLRYGFAGMKQDGNTHEKRVGYVAFDGATLYIITTAFDTVSETGKFKTLEDFQRFEPYLNKLVAGLQLPIAKPVR